MDSVDWESVGEEGVRAMKGLGDRCVCNGSCKCMMGERHVGLVEVEGGIEIEIEIIEVEVGRANEKEGSQWFWL